MEIDYRALLKKYMAEVLLEEGTTFVSACQGGDYTEAETEALQAMDREIGVEEDDKWNALMASRLDALW